MYVNGMLAACKTVHVQVARSVVCFTCLINIQVCISNWLPTGNLFGKTGGNESNSNKDIPD